MKIKMKDLQAISTIQMRMVNDGVALENSLFLAVQEYNHDLQMDNINFDGTLKSETLKEVVMNGNGLSAREVKGIGA